MPYSLDKGVCSCGFPARRDHDVEVVGKEPEVMAAVGHIGFEYEIREASRCVKQGIRQRRNRGKLADPLMYDR